MRNLKKYLAVLLTVAMLITSMAPVFADTAATLSSDVQAAKDLGMLVGDSDAGVTAAYVATTPSRAQAAVLFLRLKGLEATAKAFKGTDNFSDVSATNWFAPYAAYLKANPALGFEGVGNDEFAPEAKITAQQYYKVVLTALGYVQGKDFEYSDVVTFAASKGLSKVAKVSDFTVADVATATVEGLKAAVKGSTDTLATKLIAAGAISVEKAVYANVYVKPTPVVTKGIESITNKAASISVKLTYTPADASKVVITVKRGTVAVPATFTQDAKDKSLFVYAASANLVGDDYTVSVKDDTSDLGSKVLTIKDEKVAAIEFTSKQIIRYNDSDGYAYYKVTNQYGEDVTTKSIANSLTWNSSLGTSALQETKDGYVKLTYGNSTSDYLKKLKDFTTTPITIYVYDRDTGVTATANLTVSIAAGDIQSIKLNKIYNKDGKTEIYRNNTSDEFYIDYTITDSNGMAITSYDILSNTNVLTVYPGTSDTSTIARVVVKQDPNDSTKALFQIFTKNSPDMTNQYDGVGTQSINFIASGTGKTGAIDVKVSDTTDALETFVLQKPSTDVTEGAGWVEVPYIATDKSGNTVTAYDKIAGKVDFGSSAATRVNEVRMPDGSYKLYYKFTEAKDAIVNISATVSRTYKNSNISVTVKGVSLPYELATLPFDQYLVGGAWTTKHMGDIIVNDKYGNRVDIKSFKTNPEVDKSFYNDDTAREYNYFVVGKSLDTSKITVAGLAYGNDESLDYKLRVSAVYSNTDNFGAADVKFYLLKKKVGTTFGAYRKDDTDPLVTTDTDSNGDLNVDYDADKIITNATGSATDFKVVDTKTITFYNVDPSTMTGYAIDAIATQLYANADALVSTANGENQEIKVKGILGGTAKVILPNLDLSTEANTKKVGIIKGSVSVSDTAKFAVSSLRADASGGNTTQYYVYALPLTNNETSATANVVASVRGYNKQVYPASTAITSSTATPSAQSVTANLNGSDRVNKSDEFFTPQPVKQVAAGYYEISTANFSTFFLASGRTMNATGTAGIRFRFKDQYGKDDKADKWQSATSLSLVDDCGGKYSVNSSALTISMNTNPATGLPYAPVSGDQIIMTASRDGKVITITLKIVD